MFKMKKSDSVNQKASSAIDQLASSAKEVNLPTLNRVEKMASTDKTKEAIAKFMEGVGTTGKKIDKQLSDKGIDLKKESMGLALNSLGLATKYLAKKDTRKKIFKTAVKFVALMPVRPVLIATGVGVGVYVVAKKVKAAKLEKTRQENLELANNGVKNEVDNEKTASSIKDKSSPSKSKEMKEKKDK